MDGFYIIYNSLSVISGGWLGDDERLCAVEPCLQSERLWSQADLDTGSVGLGYPDFPKTGTVYNAVMLMD